MTTKWLFVGVLQTNETKVFLEQQLHGQIELIQKDQIVPIMYVWMDGWLVGLNQNSLWLRWWLTTNKTAATSVFFLPIKIVQFFLRYNIIIGNCCCCCWTKTFCFGNLTLITTVVFRCSFYNRSHTHTYIHISNGHWQM